MCVFFSFLGNKLTLDTIPKEQGLNVRDELLKFHDKWYSSNIMSLAILGKGKFEIYCHATLSGAVLATIFRTLVIKMVTLPYCNLKGSTKVRPMLEYNF